MSRHLGDSGSAHPILAFLDDLEAGLDEVTEAPTWSLDKAQTTQVVTRLVGALGRLGELESRALGQAETLDLAGDLGARSLVAWLSRVTRQTRAEAARQVRVAHTLAAHEQTREAMARGEVHPEQAVVIGRAVDELVGEHAHHRDLAEKHLLGLAGDHDAHALATLGRRVLEVVDPDGADEHEARLLEAQEARARKRTAMRMWDDGEGLTHGQFTMPVAQGSMLRKMLHGFSAPKHVRATEGAGSYHFEKPTPEKLGQAFCSLVERYPRDQLPKLGGLTASIIVTADHETLSGAYKAAHLDTGVAISPGQLRRWACEARLYPAILDTKSHVLDLGRSTRLHTEAQRLALIVEQKTCQHVGCDVLGAFCHVHHTDPWGHGGPTDTELAALLCPFHHHQVHAAGATYPMRT